MFILDTHLIISVGKLTFCMFCQIALHNVKFLFLFSVYESMTGHFLYHQLWALFSMFASMIGKNVLSWKFVTEKWSFCHFYYFTFFFYELLIPGLCPLFSWNVHRTLLQYKKKTPRLPLPPKIHIIYTDKENT